eukprot:gb/GECG01000182.1/.p1 GENE.gb/GECG01000182.1/~~gb/GECG01000182.1/.p1  ORF type:complete len:920 (+),score=134.06 gb/GECG01000182.1/:1-2760(+)
MHSVPLVSYDHSTGQFKAHEEGIEVLEKIDEFTSAHTSGSSRESIGLITVVGPPMSGKSWLLNEVVKALKSRNLPTTHLLDHKSSSSPTSVPDSGSTYDNGFRYGDKDDDRTQGIRIYDSCFWNGNQRLLLLDMEGMSPSKSDHLPESFAATLVSVVMAATSVVIFNTCYSDEEDAVHNMGLLSYVTSAMRLEQENPEDAETWRSCLPEMLWTVQNYPGVRESEAEGPVNANEYMEAILCRKNGKTRHSRTLNKIRSDIMEAFPSRNCLGLASIRQNHLAKEGETESSEAKHITDLLLQDTPGKSSGGVPVSGTVLARVIEVAVDATNRGTLTSMIHAWETGMWESGPTLVRITTNKYTKMLKRSVQRRSKNEPIVLSACGFDEPDNDDSTEIPVTDLPCDDEFLKQQEEMVKDTAVTFFEKLSPSNMKLRMFRHYEQQIRDEIANQFKNIIRENAHEKYQHCSQIAEDVCVNPVRKVYKEENRSIQEQTVNLEKQVEALKTARPDEMQEKLNQLARSVVSRIKSVPPRRVVFTWMETMKEYKREYGREEKCDALLDTTLDNVYTWTSELIDVFADGMEKVVFDFLNLYSETLQCLPGEFQADPSGITARLQEQQKEIETLRKGNEEKDKKIREQDESIKTLNSESKNKDSHIDEQKETIQSLFDECKKKDDQISEKEHEVKRVALFSQNGGTDTSPKNRRNSSTSLPRSRSFSAKTKDKWHNSVEHLHEELNKYTARCENLEKVIKQLNLENERLKSSLKEKEDHWKDKVSELENESARYRCQLEQIGTFDSVFSTSDIREHKEMERHSKLISGVSPLRTSASTIHQYEHLNRTLRRELDASNAIRQRYEAELQEWKTLCSRIQSRCASLQRQARGRADANIVQRCLKRIHSIQRNALSHLGKAYCLKMNQQKNPSCV